ncbi:MAG TPA: hypothetical protein VFB12_27875 [Ktedonobacteraceae bacterium]|nr:hypothetical protein [Ktedonobacteraceae bacterium]
MMSAAPPFLVSRDQAVRLQAYLQTYRQHAFSSCLPSVERNTMLRQLQTIHGKLIEAMDQRTTTVQLIFSREELAVLQTMVAELLHLYASWPESTDRLAALADLASLKLYLKRS